MRDGLEEAYRVRDVLTKGVGKLVDNAGVDWWVMMSTRLPGQLDRIVMLRQFAQSLDAGEVVYVTRPGFHASALREILGERLHSFASAPASGYARLGRYFEAARKFPLWQLAQTFWDKYDPTLEIRRHFAPRPGPSGTPVVLIPSAYVNVTRTGLAYARTVPGLSFLLVAARRSAWTESLPSNVRAGWLASYASKRNEEPDAEREEILKKWVLLRRELETEPEIGLSARLGLLDDFAEYLRVGWKARMTWAEVFRRERIQAVLCADDSNFWTRLPLLLAKNYGVPAVACHHGALDGQRIFKENAADVVLAKGQMEKDYLTRVCRIPEAEVAVGAPGQAMDKPSHAAKGAASLITFFSEPYESFSGRGEEFYRDIVPPLAVLAAQTGKRLVVKLHPAESQRERSRMIRKLLTTEQLRRIDVLTGPTTTELLQQTWFGITVLSTVATECAMQGVPCFLCRWLEYTYQGYIDQFLRFGAGLELKMPSEIAAIPQTLAKYSFDPAVAAAVWRPIQPALLERISSARPADGRQVAMEMQAR